MHLYIIVHFVLNTPFILLNYFIIFFSGIYSFEDKFCAAVDAEEDDRLKLYKEKW